MVKRILTNLKKAFRVIVVIILLLLLLYFLANAGLATLFSINSKKFRNELLKKDIRINKNDYCIFEHVGDLFRDEERGYLSNKGWTLKYPNSFANRDNNFIDDYLIFNSNADFVYCTSGDIMLKNSLSIPNTPLLKEVKSLTIVNGNNFERKEIHLNNKQLLELLSVLLNEDNCIALNNINDATHIIISNENKESYFDFYFEYENTTSLCMDGVAYCFSDQYYFVKDSDGILYIVNSGTNPLFVTSNRAV